MDINSYLDSIPGDILTPAQVAPLLDCDPNSLRAAAHRCPKQLGFPVTIIGRRVKIPKEGFRRFMKGELEQRGKDPNQADSCHL